MHSLSKQKNLLFFFFLYEEKVPIFLYKQEVPICFYMAGD